MKVYVCLFVALLIAFATYPIQSYAQNSGVTLQSNAVQFNADLFTFLGASLTCLTLSFALLTRYIITPIVRKELEEWNKSLVTKEMWQLENGHIWEAINKKRA